VSAALEPAGRSCPASYGYGPQVFQRTPDIVADTLYVIGGMYGNAYALDAIEALAACDAQHGVQPHLIFNGDFHWFDIDPAVFDCISKRVLAYTALRGNVETELADDDNTFGCGCGYPDNVSDAEVERSNRILVQLRDTARRMPRVRQKLGALPMHALAQVGDARIGIVHGDANSLAGWNFAHDSLADPVNHAALMQTLRSAGVDAFASSHTCLPALRRFVVDSRMRAIINNGAAGMPNVAATQYGIISRIATASAPDDLPVLHETSWPVQCGSIYVAAIKVEYDHAAWRARFLIDWPAGSAAHQSYFQRIEQGPSYSVKQAYFSA
jgi:hypothetical protein